MTASSSSVCSTSEQPGGEVQARPTRARASIHEFGWVLADDDDLGLGQVGQDAQPLDDRVDARVLVRADRAPWHRRVVAGAEDRRERRCR